MKCATTFCEVVQDQEFTVDLDRGGRRKRYCGPKCRYDARDRSRFVERGTILTAVCIDCGTTFSYPSATKRRRRCDACRPTKAGSASLKARTCVRCGAVFDVNRVRSDSALAGAAWTLRNAARRVR